MEALYPQQSVNPEQAATDPERLSGLIHRAGLHETYHAAVYKLAGHYLVNSLHHNREHMFEVATDVLDQCDLNDEITDEQRQAVFLAAIGHDADSHLSLTDNFTTKENRSAHLAQDAIMNTAPKELSSTELWERLRFAGFIANLIISTEPNQDIQGDPLKLILNRADLANMHDMRSETLRRAGKMFVEHLCTVTQEAPQTIHTALQQYPEELASWCTGARMHLRTLAETKHQDFRNRIKVITPRQIVAAFSEQDEPVSGQVSQ